MLNNLLIIDGSYFLHRALHAPGLSELTNNQGIKTGGIFGFLRILQSECKKQSGYYPVVCWDGGLSPRRTQLYPQYKANRKRLTADYMKSHNVDFDNEYVRDYHYQRQVLIQLLGTLGITSLLISKWEGDDLQYVLTHICKNCIIASDDKDMIQLVSPTCKIRRSMADETIVWDENDTYWHHPRFTIRKSIMGDESDNIPNVAKGLGEKTADKISLLIENTKEEDYKKTLEESMSTISPALRSKVQLVLDNWKTFETNYQLINLRVNQIPEGFEYLIKEAIKITAHKLDLFSCLAILAKHGITTIYPDELNLAIAESRKTILEDI